MRRDGWIEPVSGVRGRYRYGVTGEGRRQAPAQPADVIAETIKRGLGMLSALPREAVVPSSGPRRQLLDFVRWLVQERQDLLAGDDPDIVLKLEEAAADYLFESGREDAIERMLDLGTRGSWKP